ncbi:MaoC/PaaZ C-terminal domain-containing protein [Xanthobacter dioxanivorans]
MKVLVPVKRVIDYNVKVRVTGLDVRFSAPVHPGETVRFHIWREGGEARFSASIPERQVVVLNNGAAGFA